MTSVLYFSTDYSLTKRYNNSSEIQRKNNMKKYFLKFISIISLISVLLSVSVSAAAPKDKCWYVRRNGSCQPSFPEEAESLKQYNCYYIDERYGDQTPEKRIYLTFDAGYENGNIEKILDVLKEEEVPAAFFILDYIILKNTDLVTRMSDEGHLVCNHTKKHKNLSNSSKEEIKEDLQALEKIYYEKTGRQMSKYFRFPEGRYSESAVKAVCELGYKTVFWSFGYDDWDDRRQPNPEAAKRKILTNTHNGAIILLHPTSATNAKILGDVIKEWKALGYTFGTLDDLSS